MRPDALAGLILLLLGLAAAAFAVTTTGDTRARLILSSVLLLCASAVFARIALRKRARRIAISEAIDREFQPFEGLE